MSGHMWPYPHIKKDSYFCEPGCPACAYQTGRESREGLREALEAAQKFVAEQLEEIGACDHSVGHCVCEDMQLADYFKRALEADEETK
jgi:hypothetical protein